jgi:hypothetical protein
MIVIEFLLFVFSSGLFCRQKFRRNVWAKYLAGGIATVSSFLFVIHAFDPNILNWLPTRPAATARPPVAYTPSATRPPQQQAYLPAPNPKTVEIEHWHAAMLADTRDAYLDFLAQFPFSEFAPAARARIKTLSTRPEPTSPPATVAADTANDAAANNP